MDNYVNAGYSAMDISNWIINRNQRDVANEEDDKITLMKLLKLLYYCEGCSLALHNKSLFPEKIFAWEHGPVVKEVYHHFPNAYNLEVNEDDVKKSLEKISIEDQNLLESVYEVFGKYTAYALRDMTHNEDPWKIISDNGMNLNREIPKALIKDYFEKHYVEED